MHNLFSQLTIIFIVFNFFEAGGGGWEAIIILNRCVVSVSGFSPQPLAPSQLDRLACRFNCLSAVSRVHEYVIMIMLFNTDLTSRTT